MEEWFDNADLAVEPVLVSELGSVLQGNPLRASLPLYGGGLLHAGQPLPSPRQSSAFGSP